MKTLPLAFRLTGLGGILWFVWVVATVGFNSGCPTLLPGVSPDSLAGSTVVPPNDETSYGVASYLLRDNHNQLTFSIQVFGMTGPVTGAGFYHGAAGTNGPLLADISSLITDLGDEVVIAGTIDLDMWMLEDVVGELLSSNIHVLVSTERYPAGEVRGQVHVVCLESGIPANCTP